MRKMLFAVDLTHGRGHQTWPYWPWAGGEHGGAAVGLTTPISQTSDCDRGGLLKLWVVEANSQMSH